MYKRVGDFFFYCFQYCKIGQNCAIIDSSKSCSIGNSQLSVSGKRYCALKNLKNSLIDSSSGPVSLTFNSTMPPLFSLQNDNKVQYYVYNGDQSKNLDGQTCKAIVNSMGTNIQSVQKIQSQGYLICLQYLFYTLIPIFGFTIFSSLIQTFTKYDCKRILQISLFNSCIISVSLIIIGIVFDMKSSDFEDKIKWIGQNCLINSTYAESIRLNLTADMVNGLSSVFTIMMGVVGIFQIFLIVVLLILWIVQIRMTKLRKQDFSSGYQLQSM